MEDLKQARKHFAKLGWFFILAILIIHGVQYVELLIADKLIPDWEDRGGLIMLLSTIPMYLFGFPVLVLLMKKYVPAVRLMRHKISVGKFLVALVTCIGLAYASNFAGTLLTFIISRFTGNPIVNPVQELTDMMTPGMILFYVVLLAPIVEEFIFRKLIVDHTVRYGQGIAILLSGLMFGFFHGNLNQFCYTTVLGCFLAFLYLKTGDIRVTISLHMIFNFVGGFVPVILMKNENLMRFMNQSADDMSDEAILQLFEQNAGILIALLLFGLMVILFTLAGVILTIVFACTGKFQLTHKETDLPKGTRFRTVILNLGMLVYIGYWVVRIVSSLVA